MSAKGSSEGNVEPTQETSSARKASGVVKYPKGCDVHKDTSLPGPDGGLSWAIAITCFVINFIGAFFGRCPGMFFNSVMDTFDATRGDASVPISLYAGFYNMAGLVAGALIGSFGVRPTIMLSGVMMAIGFGVSLFATSTLFLVFTVGVLAGAGQGMVFSCSIVAVSGYFDKRRGMALGLNAAGVPMASLLVPKLLELLLGEYGLRGTFLILGGCMANITVLGILLRNPPWEKSIRQCAAPVQKKECCTEAVNRGCEPVSLRVNRNNDDPLRRFNVRASPTLAGGRRRSIVTSVMNHKGVNWDTTAIPSRVRDTGVAWKGTASNHRRFSSRVLPPMPEQRPSIVSRQSTIAGSVVASSRRSSSIAPAVSPRSDAMERRGTMMSVAGSMIASRRASLNEGGVFSRRGTTISVIGWSIPENNETTSVEPTRMTAEAPSSALSSLKEVLCTPQMYFHTFSFFTCAFFVDSYLTVMFDLGEDVGVPASESVVALTILSALDVVGRFFVPFLTDYGVTSAACLLTLSYVMLAVISALVPCITGRLMFLAASALLGLPSGYIIVGTSETLSKELGTKNLPMAYGVLAFIAALGSFARPPVVGAFRDGLGSYDGLFQLMAGILLASSLFNAGLWMCGRFFTRKGKTKQADQHSMPVSISEPQPALIYEDQCTSL
uniref:Putative monocarboxylate transporter n=1 Tax=Rhipicephalus pulchellus TaxID=72859 RepID=L7M849_RHIPC